MSITKFKRFIALFIVTILLLSFIMPNFEGIEYLAATVITSTTETTKKKAVGHKIEGAEYYDELWNKFSVIAVDNGGGSGQGGGAGDNNTKNAGNSGQYNDAGGTFGHAAGQGLGTGNTANQSGQGSGTSGGSTGSVKADTLRALKAQIEESRAESLKRVLETAKNIESVAASIAERESIQSSIQKRIQQESIKAKIAQPETQKQYETPFYVEETVRRTQVRETKAETVSPTSTERLAINFDNEVVPTSVEKTLFSIDSELIPTPAYVEDYEIVVEEVQTIKFSEFEPGDFIEETVSKNRVSSSVNPVLVNKPTGAREETVPQTTIKVFDTPIVEAETSAVESEIVKEENPVQVEEKNDASDEEDGQGSKGGEDAEKYEDMTGDEGENESEGNAENRGKYHKEEEGEYAGKKIFELEQNGDFGIDPEHLSVTNLKGMMTAVTTLLLLLGALTFVFGTRDRFKKNNYF